MWAASFHVGAGSSELGFGHVLKDERADGEDHFLGFLIEPPFGQAHQALGA